MRVIVMIVGLLAFVAGVFWAAQGYGLVQWPPHASGQFSMVGDMRWVYYGIATAVIGLLLILFARRRA